MNNQRRKEIAAIVVKIAELQSLRDDIRDSIDSIKSEEDDYRDNMPESLQGSERYSTSETASDYLQNAYDEFNIIDFDEITGYLESAKE